MTKALDLDTLSGRVKDKGTRDSSSSIIDVIEIDGYKFECIREPFYTGSNGSLVDRPYLDIISIQHAYSNGLKSPPCPLCKTPISPEGSATNEICSLLNEKDIKYRIAKTLKIKRIFYPPKDLRKLK